MTHNEDSSSFLSFVIQVLVLHDEFVDVTRKRMNTLAVLRINYAMHFTYLSLLTETVIAWRMRGEANNADSL